jgi:pentatricopeptide repeat protein
LSDPDSEYKQLLSEISQKAKMGYWKAAIRKLKRLRRCYPNTPPREIYLETLQSCASRRLQGARAAEPARKIIEQIVEAGYELPIDLANACIQNAIGDGPQGTHDGFGGVDTALAMLAAVEEISLKTGKEILTVESFSKVVSALTKETEASSLDYALQLLRSMVVEKSMTPSLETLADVAMNAATTTGQSEKVLTVLAYTKAAGFVLDTLASTADGRKLLAAGVIAAEQLNNAALGLRLLTSASMAQGCAPARGDDLVSSSSSLAQRASTLIHKRAIQGAIQDGNWKLAVRVLELMLERSLKPSPNIWRSVVTCCAKAEKSRKATALLLDWVRQNPRLSFLCLISCYQVLMEYVLTFCRSNFPNVEKLKSPQ